MPQSTRTALHSTRLVRTLAALVETPLHDSARQFSHRLGTLIDLGDSVSLASAQMDVKQHAFKPGPVVPADVRGEFLSGRAVIINGILRSCVPGASVARIRFPQIVAETPQAEATAPDAYIAFYRAQQSEIGYRVLRLHNAIRSDVAVMSPELGQLAALDAALGAAMGNHLRRYFNAVPELLKQRFLSMRRDYFEQQPGGGYQADSWLMQLGQLRADIQSLLLAEAEARLLPVQGLVEALTDTMD